MGVYPPFRLDLDDGLTRAIDLRQVAEFMMNYPLEDIRQQMVSYDLVRSTNAIIQDYWKYVADRGRLGTLRCIATP